MQVPLEGRLQLLERDVGLVARVAPEVLDYRVGVIQCAAQVQAPRRRTSPGPRGPAGPCGGDPLGRDLLAQRNRRRVRTNDARDLRDLFICLLIGLLGPLLRDRPRLPGEGISLCDLVRGGRRGSMPSL